MSGKPCYDCEGKRTAGVHSKHHPEYHPYRDSTEPGLKHVSAGMSEFRRTSGYDKAVKAAEGSPCQVQSPECTGTAEHLHEIKSRGRHGGLRGAYRGPEDGTPCCDACNAYIGQNPVWAAEQGWLKSATVDGTRARNKPVSQG